ncbi:ArnT family glycosyltransferase [Novosphingobium sp. JCM 18896]|uniref:ArnT family glycosyltransferase n=1 Tax=Novosphingobium sp. JCM 18896 TaxID=2989731 RepID=UPI0022228D16|nr:glycosyltransferase family 39 protein [Novosphingobium sp. JCM 18896]MCW1429451.1 glycosyltransferase family 39 protein [Novosphingobium sp. JCM 18896]
MHGYPQVAPGSVEGSGSAGDWFARSRAALVLVWAAYLLPRIAILLIEVTPTSDAGWYYGRAVDLAAGLGYYRDGIPTAYWPPGQSLALAVVFWCFGASTLVVGLFNLVVGTIAGWLTLDLGKRIFASQAAGRAGLLLLAVYPNAIGYYPLALTEVFYTTLLLGCCWLLIARRSMMALVFAGLLFGLASLVKAQTIIVLPLIFAIALLRRGRSLRQVLARVPGIAGRTALVGMIAALTVLPWTLRNHDAFGQWVAVSTNGGITLLTGNNDSARGGFTPEDPVVLALDARKDLDEIAYDAEAKRLGLRWIAENPGRFVALMPLKLLRLWGPDGEAVWNYETGAPAYARAPGLFRAVRYANQAYYLALLAGFGLAFAVLLRRAWMAGRRWLGLVDWWLLPFGIAAYPSVIAMVFSGQSRFHYPVMPFVCMTCGWLAVFWLTRRQRSLAG